MTRLPVAGPWITEKEIAHVTDAVTNAWYDQASMYHERFERAFEEVVAGFSPWRCLPAPPGRTWRSPDSGSDSATR